MAIKAAKPSLQLKAKLFRGFSDGSRLGILEALRSGPLMVSEIMEVTGLSQSNTSNHLSCLRDCGLVTARPEGRHVWYQLTDDRVYRVLQLADDVLQDTARGVNDCARYNTRTELRRLSRGSRRIGPRSHASTRDAG